MTLLLVFQIQSKRPLGLNIIFALLRLEFWEERVLHLILLFSNLAMWGTIKAGVYMGQSRAVICDMFPIEYFFFPFFSPKEINGQTSRRWGSNKILPAFHLLLLLIPNPPPLSVPHTHAAKTRISGDYFQSSCLTQSTYSKLLLERLSEAVKDVETLPCRSNGA